MIRRRAIFIITLIISCITTSVHAQQGQWQNIGKGMDEGNPKAATDIEIQYCDADGQFTGIFYPTYPLMLVPKGFQMRFKAVITPVDAVGPDEQYVWGGMAHGNTTQETSVIAFNTVSPAINQPFMVSVTCCDTTKFIQIIVFDADIVIALSTNTSISTGNDAANVLPHHRWPKDYFDGENQLGRLGHYANQSLLTPTLGMGPSTCIGRMQATTLLRPTGMGMYLGAIEGEAPYLLTSKRDRRTKIFHNGGTYTGAPLHWENAPTVENTIDTSHASWQDQNPLSGNSSNEIYDLDAPGTPALIYKTFEYYTNFRQWAEIGMYGRSHKITSDKYWRYYVNIDATVGVDNIIDSYELKEITAAEYTDDPPKHYETVFMVMGTIKTGVNPLSDVTVTAEKRKQDNTYEEVSVKLSTVNGVYRLLCPIGHIKITPSKLGYQFNPANIEVDIVNADMSGKDFTWEGSLTISGRVTQNNNGVAGILITVGAINTTTAADGTYTFQNLPPGNITVVPSKEGLTFTPANRAIQLVGDNVADINFTAVQQ